MNHQAGCFGASSDLFLCSCSSRSCSSLSRCSRACLRFSASTRAASSGSLVPADGLPAEGEGAVEGVRVAATEAAAGGAAASMTGTAGEATVTGLGEGGAGGPEDTTMAGTVLQPGRHTVT